LKIKNFLWSNIFWKNNTKPLCLFKVQTART